MRKVFIAGCGYIGKGVARLEQEKGAQVAALARSDDSEAGLRALGIETVRGDLDDPASLINIDLNNAILYYFAPPPPKGRIDSRIGNLLSVLREGQLPQRVVLISTTGVYGDCKGEWITEERTPKPQADRAFRRLNAETKLSRWADEMGAEYVVLRVPGIYGPGKLPEKRLRDSLPVLREEDSPFSNRIHAEDLARACIVAAERGRSGEVYNVSDDLPSTMTDYFLRVADLLGIPRPPEISLEEAKAQLGEGILSYLAESKRIDNRKMREELGVKLRYPDLLSGLPTCMPSDT